MSHKSGQLPPRDVVERARATMRANEARENVRRQQQGDGKAIISTTDGDYRFVAVGNTVHWGKNWHVFPDFLLYFLKKMFGARWAAREKPRDHQAMDAQAGFLHSLGCTRRFRPFSGEPRLQQLRRPGRPPWLRAGIAQAQKVSGSSEIPRRGRSGRSQAATRSNHITSPRCQSDRSASTGSTRAAWRAGRYDAASATAATRIEIATNV
jgi:hypothetical protein